MGGAERHTLDLLLGLRAFEFDTKLFLFGDIHSPFLRESLGADDAVIAGDAGKRLWDLPGQIADAIVDYQPHLIVAVNQTAVIAAGVAAMRSRTPVVVVFHTTKLPPRDRLKHPPFWAVTRFTSLLVYVSQNQASYWRKRGLGARSEVVIQNGVDLELFSPDRALRQRKREALDIREDDVVFGVVATFRPEKAHLDLVAAFASLADRTDGAKLLLIGDGPERQAVEREVHARGLGPKVIFAGEQKEVGPWIAAMDVGVLCSRSVETFSLAALETLAMGVPMILSRTGGASEIVRPGVNGFLYEVGAVERLAYHLEQMLDAPLRMRLAEQARASVSHLSSERMMRQYARAFTRLVADTEGEDEPPRAP